MALSDSEMAIKLKPDWQKGYYRKGCALEAAQKLEEAMACFLHAQSLDGASVEVAAKVRHLGQMGIKAAPAAPAAAT